MSGLALQLLGSFNATYDDHQLNHFRTKSVQALLIYLACQPEPHRRESLMALLWPEIDQASAQNNLRQALYHLRQAIPEVPAKEKVESVPFLLADRQTIQVNPEAAYELDVQTFEQRLNGSPEARQEAAALYRGDFLQDFYLPDSAPFEDWVAARRAALKRQALEALDKLAAEALARGDLATAERCAWQQLDIDNLREPAYQQLMTALARSGRRSAALAQYEIYRRRLEEALGAQPAVNMQELYRRIQADELRQTMLRRPPAVQPKDEPVNPIFCYTDIENSTRLWDEHREAMLVALGRHNDLIETAVEQYDGRILHPTGDGYLIVFERNNPLAFALALQEQFAANNWGEIGDLRIRIGLHGATANQEGHDFFREDGGYRGPVLNHAARIADTGHGGQIVASAMVKGCCPLPEGASWEDLGSHRLKSLDDEYHIYGLLHPALEQHRFPPLRTPALKQVEGRIRGYLLKNIIGQGAFGEVYLAQQPGVGRDVAVKIIRARYVNEPAFIRRFEAEAQVIARLEHPYIVPLHDYWREAEGAYLVMRYLRGGSLQSSLREGPWDLNRAVQLVDQVAGGLAFAHRQGVVHRDIKPANILLDEEGNAYLSDFGIAKDVSAESGLTESGAVLGSPAYISPEQALNEAITPLTDIYSLGIVCFELLTGRHPFADLPLAAMLNKQQHDPLPLLSAYRPNLPAELNKVIQRATAKNPAERYADALAVAAAFRAAANGGEAVEIFQPAELVNPYKGLRPFEAADDADFFGRKALIDQLLARMAEPGPEAKFLAVVGPSGSGKSSVVKAGLLPALRQGGLPDSQHWFTVAVTPSTRPLDELEIGLLRVAVRQPAGLGEQLRRDEFGLVRAARLVLPDDQSTLLLVIDQFEELFTATSDPQTREQFLCLLAAAATDPGSPLRILITLRADFYDRPLLHPEFGRLVRDHTAVVLPLTVAELTEAVTGPAERTGAKLEAGLVPAIVADVAEEVGALPMFQYALTELFNRRDGRTLTNQAYQAIGGVSGALARRAEEIFSALSAPEQEAARQIFLRLVTLGEGVEDTRRRVLRSELETIRTSAAGEGTAVTTTIDTFGRARLLTFDRDPATREPTVEVAHEALLREWERLRGWLDESREDVRLQQRLAAAAAEWRLSGQDMGFLVRGSRLEQLAGWAAASKLALTPEEQRFLEASIAAREERRAEEEARRQRELQTAQQLAVTESQRAEEQAQAAANLRRRAVWLAGALAVAAILAVLAIFAGRQANINANKAAANLELALTRESDANKNAALAEEAAAAKATSAVQAQSNADLAATREKEALQEASQRATAQAQAVAEGQRADAARITAEEQAQISFSRELAASALANLEVDPERSALLALYALDTVHTQEAEDALHAAVPNLRTLYKLTAHETEIKHAAYSPDGTRLVTLGDDAARIWDTASGEELVQITVPGEPVRNLHHSRSIAYSPDGTFIVTGGEDGAARIWDAENGEERLILLGHQENPNINLGYTESPNWVSSVAVSPDNQTVATGGGDRTVMLWDAATGTEIKTFTFPEPITSISQLQFTPDGSQLIISGYNLDWRDHHVWLIDLASGEELLDLEGVHIFALSPDGSQLLVGGGNPDGIIHLWELQTGTELDNYAVSNYIGLEFSPDGSFFATTTGDGAVHIWDVATAQEVLTLRGHHGVVNEARFSPDGRSLATVSNDFTARIWDISPSHELLTIMPFFDLENDQINRIAINPDWTLMAAATSAGEMVIWDLTANELLWQLEGHDNYVNNMAFSPDGSLLASCSDDGTVKVWDPATGELLMTLTDHGDWVGNIAYSPDGKTFATVGGDKNLIVYDAETGQVINKFPNAQDWGAFTTAYSPDGKLIATGEFNGNLTLWDPESGEAVRVIDNELPFNDNLFTPDGSQLIVACMNGILKSWDPNSGALNWSVDAHQGSISTAQPSPDGRIIATGSIDKTVGLWDANTGERLVILEGHTLWPSDAVFSPDSRVLATSSGDGSVRFWAIPLEDEIALAESRLTRGLTEDECQTFLHLDECPVE